MRQTNKKISWPFAIFLWANLIGCNRDIDVGNKIQNGMKFMAERTSCRGWIDGCIWRDTVATNNRFEEFYNDIVLNIDAKRLTGIVVFVDDLGIPSAYLLVDKFLYGKEVYWYSQGRSREFKKCMDFRKDTFDKFENMLIEEKIDSLYNNKSMVFINLERNRAKSYLLNRELYSTLVNSFVCDNY